MRADNRVRLERGDDPPPHTTAIQRTLLEALASGFLIVTLMLITRPYSQGPGIALSAFEFSK